MKNLYKIRFTVSLFVFALAIFGAAGVFYGVKIFDIQFLPLLQRIFEDFSIAVIIIFLALFIVTLLFGRIYCSLVCPVGILQEIFSKFKKKKSIKPNSNFPVKYFILAAGAGAIFGGTALFIRYFDPYTIFVSAVSLSLTGVISAIIIILIFAFKDRFFCTNICPIGAILGLISKFSLFKIRMNEKCVSCSMCEKNCPSGAICSKEKTVDNEICTKCFKCLSVCKLGGIQYSRKTRKRAFNLKRRQIILSAASIMLFGAMVKAGAIISAGAKKFKDIILPPGAVNSERFISKCLNCNLCVQNCPNKIIKKADENFPAVHLDYNQSYCEFNCTKCNEVCPAGAIKRLTKEEKQKTRIAMAVVNKEECIKCGICKTKCPNGAIIQEKDGLAFVNGLRCTGCGACKNNCPSGAIQIFSVKEQKTI